MPLIQNRDIVVIGLQQWYTKIGSNCKNIALEFAKHNRVLYVNSPLDRRTILTQKKDPDVAYHLRAINNEVPRVVAIRDNFWNLYPAHILESINWIPATGLFSMFNKENNRRFAKSIREGIAALGFKDVILFNDNDIFRGYYLKEMLRPASYVYYSRDYLLTMDYWKRHAPALEPLLIAKADVAVANSLYLADRLKAYNKHSYYVGQGCELGLFNAAQAYEKPADLSGISSPVIGYVGALTNMRLDMEIISTISHARPEWNIVLVGPEDEAFRQSSLHQLPNVHFLGRKEMKELPAYVQHFDVCINPQLLNPVTMGNYPLKIDEYLAMGKPTVATDTPTMALFRDHTYLAKDAAGYVPLIEAALKEDPAGVREARIGFAHSHTWENSVSAIYDGIAKSW